MVNVGDRVFFESDSSELTPQSIATLEKQAQWLQVCNQYTFTIEGHADERGTREYNIALGACRAQTVRDYPLPRAAFRPSACARFPTARSARSRSATTFPALVAEPPRGDGAQYQFLSRGHGGSGRRSRAPVVFRASTFDRVIVISPAEWVPRRGGVGCFVASRVSTMRAEVAR